MATHYKNLTVSSGSIWGRLELILTPKAYNVAGNYTPVDYVYRIRRTATTFGGYWSNLTQKGSLVINGTTIAVNDYTYDFRSNYTKVLASGTINVGHNSDGTKTMAFSGSITTTGNVPSGSITGSEVLPQIPRASTITTFANFTMGNNVPFTLDKKYSAFVHRIELLVGNDVIASLDTSSASGQVSINMAAKLALISKLNATSKSVTATLRVRTYTNSNYTTQVGATQTQTATATALNADIAPVPSITSIAEAGSGLSSFTVFVQSKSKLRIRSSATTNGSATISRTQVTFDGVNYQGNDITTSTVEKTGTLSVTVTVTDSRGVSSSITQNVTIIAYFAPRILKFNVQRYPDGESTDLRAEVSFEIAPVSNQNAKNYILRYRRVGQGNTNLVNSSAYYERDVVHQATGILNTDYTYEIELVLSDSFGTIDPIVAEISTGFELLNWNASGKGWATGKVSEDPNAFEVGMPLKMFDSLLDKNGHEVLATTQRSSDTRNDNETPGWYYTNFPNATVKEFKALSAIGLGPATGTYALVETIVPWSGTSGGEVKQIAYGNNNEIYNRSSLNDTTWRPWSVFAYGGGVEW